MNKIVVVTALCLQLLVGCANHSANLKSSTTSQNINATHFSKCSVYFSETKTGAADLLLGTDAEVGSNETFFGTRFENAKGQVMRSVSTRLEKFSRADNSKATDNYTSYVPENGRAYVRFYEPEVKMYIFIDMLMKDGNVVAAMSYRCLKSRGTGIHI